MEEQKKGKASALLPIVVFLIIFLGAGIVFDNFYAMPIVNGYLYGNDRCIGPDRS